MWKSRLGYGILAVVFAVLLFFFSQSFFWWILIGMFAVAVGMALLLRRDARYLEIELRAKSGIHVGDTESLILHVKNQHRIFAAAGAEVKIIVDNKMFGRTEQKTLWFDLSDISQEYEIGLPLERCGEIMISCEEIRIYDFLRLFSLKAAPFHEERIRIYPQPVSVQIELSRTTIGAQKEEGIMQNRKGKDPSEMFDIREYVPGDDIRSIHWKLSSKTDSLILRQSSDPSHYNVVILPDFGQNKEGEPSVTEEINRAVAFGMTIGEKLIRHGIEFCMALPLSTGLKMYEIRTIQDYYRMQMEWMSFPIQKESGAGLQLFMTEHLEEYFTRMIILSAGIYGQSLGALDGKIGITVINANREAEDIHVIQNGTCEIVDVPTKSDAKENYRIIC